MRTAKRMRLNLEKTVVLNFAVVKVIIPAGSGGSDVRDKGCQALANIMFFLACRTVHPLPTRSEFLCTQCNPSDRCTAFFKKLM